MWDLCSINVKKYLININIHYIWASERGVINLSHVDKSLRKHKMDEITSLYKFYNEKFWLYRKPTRGSEIFYVMQFIINLFNSSWYCSWRGNNESHHIGNNTRFLVDMKTLWNERLREENRIMLVCLYCLWKDTHYNEIYLDQLKTVDNIIIDICPLVDLFEEKYK